ncbi:MAG: maleylpyruvate isomerase N-terminal domain-containing protein [Anaerolineae bacterium]|nr:maleylpyruvate isomerase N-terminal domain-containing protein [Anaerolineae bacterium]
MNAVDILKYGHLTFQGALARVPIEAWHAGGVCGVWSVKDIIAHLASYEELLADILGIFLGDEEAPHLQHYLELGPPFNDIAVAARQALSAEQALAEYNQHHTAVMRRIPQIPMARCYQPGTLPWYGAEYALDDFLVYQYYGHKREHSAQIAVYADVVEQEQTAAATA